MKLSMKKTKKDNKKPYNKPTVDLLGDMVKITLPGGSKGAEGNSGKGDTFG